jgi:hypothetical protein
MTSRLRGVGVLLCWCAISGGCGSSAPEGTAGAGTGSTTTAAANGTASTADAGAKAPRDSSGVFINEHELSRDQVEQLVAIYRLPPPRGHFWYDTKNGLYGVWGREAAGYIRPGHDFGALPENASNGQTGVFVNGRQLNDAEVAFLQILFNGQVRRGRATVDAAWNVYDERGVWVANLAVALQQAQRVAAGNRSWSWRDGTGAAMASDGACTMMAVPGAPVYGTSGC